jgi:hypothetical protein
VPRSGATASNCASRDSAQVALPNLIGIFSKFDACGLALALSVEQADLYSGRMRIEQGKIDASAIPRSAERMRQTRKPSLIWFLSTLTIFPLSRC